MKKTLFLTLAVLGVPSVYADTTVLADDLVSKYILKEDGSMSFEYKEGSNDISFNKTITTDKKLTIDVDGGKSVTINGGNPGGSVNSSQGLEKTGSGDLNIRLNDINRNISSNDFSGSVTVTEGNMTLLHKDSGGDRQIRGYIGGGGDQTEVVVNKDATLQMMSYTGVSVPNGNESSSDNKYVQIDGANELNIDGTAIAGEWAKAEGSAVLSNVKVTNKSLSRYSGGENDRAVVKADSVALYYSSGASADSLQVDKADILANEFTVNGHAVLSNSRVYATSVTATSVGSGEEVYGMLVSNKSEVYCGQKGSLNNVTVDATSKLKYVGEKNLEEYQALFLTGENMLEMKGSQDGGVAHRTVAENQSFFLQNGDEVMARTINYTTDQLEGDVIYAWEGGIGKLDIKLQDSDISSLMDKDADGNMDNVVFTLTLVGLDSTLCMQDTDTGLLNPEMISLEIPSFSSQSVAGYYDAQTNSTTFRFSNLANVELPSVPEPATATLSLLALAGLAARRRRKA